MRVVPVIDLRGGLAVRAQGGSRAHYRPIADAPRDPTQLARRLLDQTGGNELYLADLDAIEGRTPNRAIWRALERSGVRVWLDAGFRSIDDTRNVPADTLVAGLETLDGPEVLKALIDRDGPERVVFSVDLRSGRPITRSGARWGTIDPVRLAELAIGMGCARLLLLDLARVGTGSGTGAADWLRAVRGLAGEAIEPAVGGGLSGIAELETLADAGAAAVLAASALHDGRLDRRSIERWRGSVADRPAGLFRLGRVPDDPVELPLPDDQEQVEQAGEEQGRHDRDQSDDVHRDQRG